MKHNPFFILFFALSFQALPAQTEPATPTNAPPLELSAVTTMEEKVFEQFELQKSPTFPGGPEALYQFIAKELHYPESARMKNIRGMVVLTFIVEKNGTITNVNIVKDIGHGCGEEAKRVVLTMPPWTPGELKGLPIRAKYTLPFKFALD